MFQRAGAENLPQLIQSDFLADIELDQHQNRAVQRESAAILADRELGIVP